MTKYDALEQKVAEDTGYQKEFEPGLRDLMRQLNEYQPTLFGFVVEKQPEHVEPSFWLFDSRAYEEFAGWSQVFRNEKQQHFFYLWEDGAITNYPKEQVAQFFAKLFYGLKKEYES